MVEYEFITEARFARRIAASNGRAYTSRSSRRVTAVRGHVLAGLGHGVAEEVLGRRDHAGVEVIALQAADEGDAERRREVRVFAVGLVHAAPARVARDVEHRGERLGEADRAHLLTDELGHLLDGVRVPGRGQRDRGRERREARGDDAVQGLVVEDGRDAGAGVLDEVPLQRVDRRGDLRRALRAEHADARDLADAAAERLLDGCGHDALRADQAERHDADELLGLLFDRQLRGEARGALVGGAGGGDVDAIHDESVLRCDQLV